MKAILNDPISISTLQLYNQTQMEKQKGKEPLKIILKTSTTGDTEEPPPTLGYEESSTADDDIDGNYTKDSHSYRYMSNK